MTAKTIAPSGAAGVGAPPRAASTSPRLSRTPLRVHLGLALQKYRLRRGLTQARLAEFADLSLKYVGEIERGEANSTLAAIERLAEALDWNPMDALDGAREPITEGVRALLLDEVAKVSERFTAMARWLTALDPDRHPEARLGVGAPVAGQARKRVRARARPSSVRRTASPSK